MPQGHKHTEQNILNWSFDETYRSLVFQELETPMAVKITENGAVTYIAKAPAGSSQSDPVWQVRKVDETTGTVITWADGDGNFDNIATDLTALTYS
jgi:hypothetical protein